MMGRTPDSTGRWRSFFRLRPYRRPPRFALLIILPAFLVVEREASRPLDSGIRCLVLERYDLDPATWRAMAALGANLVALAGPPGPEADRAAGSAGLDYLAFLTSDEIPSFVNDPARVAEARAERNLAGFSYVDASVAAEGFTTPEVQQRAYTALKGLFPDKLVLYPTRLDPIVWSPDFLDRYFRPEFTDLVTPYFYPVGTTVIGEAREQDDWRPRLASLLAALAPRVPAGKGILPVLQGYEQQGYPVGARFPASQLSVYRQVWPGLAHAAFDGWELPGTEPLLVELANLPTLQEGVCSLFAVLAGPPARCGLRPTLAWR
jgi:hypothetical protein